MTQGYVKFPDIVVPPQQLDYIFEVQKSSLLWQGDPKLTYLLLQTV